MPKNIVPIDENDRMTLSQQGKVCDLLMAKFRKYVQLYQLSKRAAQTAIMDHGEELAQEMFELVRKRIEAHSDLVVRRVSVNRTEPLEQLLKRIKTANLSDFIDEDTFFTIPKEGPVYEEIDLFFLPMKYDMTMSNAKDLLEEYGLVLDPFAQTQFYLQDPAFAREYRHTTSWDINLYEEIATFIYFTRNGVRCVRPITGRTMFGGKSWLAGRLPFPQD